MEKSIKFIQESINVTRLLNDKQGECMALLNLSNVHLEIGKNEISGSIRNSLAGVFAWRGGWLFSNHWS